MTERELKKLAKKKGFIKTSFGKGSHEVWKHPDGRTVTIPKPKENDYRPGTLGKILKVLDIGRRVNKKLPPLYWGGHWLLSDYEIHLLGTVRSR